MRVDSQTVQGEGSFVVMRRPGKSQRRAAGRILAETFGRKLPGENEISNVVVTSKLIEDVDTILRDLLIANVVTWNWVDDTDGPLPLPRADPAMIDSLTGDEVDFLVQTLTGNTTSSSRPGPRPGRWQRRKY